ncbi:hypothetical protein HN51_007271 [Arachis hypogaea]
MAIQDAIQHLLRSRGCSTCKVQFFWYSPYNSSINATVVWDLGKGEVLLMKALQHSVLHQQILMISILLMFS